MEIKKIVLMFGLLAGIAPESFAQDADDEAIDETYVKADSAKKVAEFKLRKDIMRAIRSSMSDGKFTISLRKTKMTNELKDFLEGLDYKIDMNYNEDYVEISWK